MTSGDLRKEFIKTIKGLTGRHGIWKVWSDFIQAAACTISNACDIKNFDEREEQYLGIIKDYTREELEGFARLIALMSLALMNEPEQDFLGSIYMELELGNKHGGQYFTPYSVCKLMAQISLSGAEQTVREKGYVSISDCACGAGATLIAGVAEVKYRLRQAGFTNYREHILIAAQDIDYTAALMCYLQLSMLGIAAYIKVGDTLADPMIEGDDNSRYWYTPMYFSNAWKFRRFIDRVKELSLPADNKTA